MANTKKYISLDKLGVYDEKIKKVISDGDAASLQSAKDYADSLAVNYDAAGTATTEAGKVQAELEKEVTRAKAREDEIAGLVSTAQGEIDALETTHATDKAALEAKDAELLGKINAVDAKVGEVPEGSTVMGIITNIQENAYDDTAIKALIEDNADAIDAIEADYLKAADKTELANAIAAEKQRAEGIEGGIDTRLKAVEDDYLKNADKVELDGKITENANAIAGVKEEVDAFFLGADRDGAEQFKDTLRELQDYIASDETGAAEMAASIKQNADDIDALEGRMETAEGDIDAVEGRATVVEGKVATLESQMTAVQGAVATKAESQALTDAVTTLQGVDAGQETRIANLEAKFGGAEGSVEDMIADAKAGAEATAAADATTKANKALEDANKYTDAEIDKVEGTIATLQGVVDGKASNADLTTLAGRVTVNEGDIAQLKTDVDAVEVLAAANKSAHEANTAAIALKASQADLEAVSGRVTSLETWHNNFTEASEEEINALFA